MNTRKIGNRAEDKACKYLTEHGYRIIERNFYSKFGEIDIIAYKDDVLHFIEVKSGNNFEPVYNITPSKIKRIVKTAQYYMKLNKLDPVFCIDAVIVKDGVEHLVNISF